jgi:hypothetical protein
VSSFKAQYLREMTMENHEKPYSLQPVIWLRLKQVFPEYS